MGTPDTFKTESSRGAHSTMTLLLVGQSLPEVPEFQAALERSFYYQYMTFIVTSVPSTEAAKEELKDKTYDLIVFDTNIENPLHEDEIVFLRNMVSNPIVVLATSVSTKKAIEYIHAGADDVIIKHYTDEDWLADSLCWAVERKEMLNALQGCLRRDENGKPQLVPLEVRPVRGVPLDPSFLDSEPT